MFNLGHWFTVIRSCCHMPSRGFVLMWGITWEQNRYMTIWPDARAKCAEGATRFSLGEDFYIVISRLILVIRLCLPCIRFKVLMCAFCSFLVQRHHLYCNYFLPEPHPSGTFQRVDRRLFLCALASSLPFCFEMVRSITVLITSYGDKKLYAIATDFWWVYLENNVEVVDSHVFYSEATTDFWLCLFPAIALRRCEAAITA